MKEPRLLAAAIFVALIPIAGGAQVVDHRGRHLAMPYYPDLLRDQLEGSVFGSQNRRIQAVAVQGKYAYVGVESWMVVVDISDPRRPAAVGHTMFLPEGSHWNVERVFSIAVSGDYVYLVPESLEHTTGMVVVDVSKPASPCVVGSYYVAAPPTFSVTVSGQYAYLYQPYGVNVVDISRPTAPRRVGFWNSHNSSSYVQCAGQHVAISGRHAYVADRDGSLRVVDVADPAAPKEVGSCDCGYAHSVAAVGKHAFVYGLHGPLSIVDVSDPKNPKVVASDELEGYTSYEGTTGVLAVSGKYLFLPGDLRSHNRGFGGLLVMDVSSPASLEAVYPVPDQPTFSLKSPVSALALQGDYAYMGLRRRLVVADFSDPKRPSLLGSTDLRPCELTDVAVARDHVLVASRAGGVRVLDVSDPESPKQVGSYRPPGPIETVAYSDNRAFAGEERALHVLDVSDPKAPREATAYATTRPTPQISDREENADKLENNRREIVTHRQQRAPEIAVVRNHACVTAAGKTDVIGGGRGGTYTVAETVVRILDLSEPTAPKETGIYEPRPRRLGHEARIAACGDHLVAMGYGSSHLRVIDLSYLAWKPWMPYLATLAVMATAGMALVIFRVRRSLKRRWLLLALIVCTVPLALLLLVPRGPREVGEYEVRGRLLGLAAAEPYAYVVGVSDTQYLAKAAPMLWVVDISDPTAPREIGSVKLSESEAAWDVAVEGNHACVADGPHGLSVVDVSDPAAPKLVGSCATPGFAQAVAVAGENAFVADGRRGLRVFDISNPTTPKPIGWYDSPPAQ